MFNLLQQTSGFVENSKYNLTDLELLQTILTNNRYTTELTMETLYQPCDALLIRCRWQTVIYPCMQIFEKSLSIDGHCCSFNLKRQFHTLNLNGITSGLSIVLEPSKTTAKNITQLPVVDTYYTEGIKLLIHETTIYPSDLSVKRILSRKYETAIRLTATATTLSNDVKLLSADDRGCLLKNEKELRFYKEYREFNCDFECRMIEIYESCQCLPFYFPNNEDIPICNFTKISCLVDNYSKNY